MDRAILHVDMDEFFAAVERLDNPALRGRCVLVAGAAESRGVVATASYEARRFGCHSAMPTARALRLCPQAVVIRPRHDRYIELSRTVFGIFRRFSPLIEPLSIDEAFLDVTGSERLFGSPPQVARAIRTACMEEQGLVASVGVAPNKFLAKLASDMDKPDGLFVIRPGEVHAILDPLPVRRLWGIGPAAEKRLRAMGIATVADLRRRTIGELRGALGNAAEHFLRLANGQDDRAVTPDHEAKSIGQEETFAEDIADRQVLETVLHGQVQHIARRLRRCELRARTITLKLRDADFVTETRSLSLDEATDETQQLCKAARHLFTNWWAGRHRPLRLIGASLSGLTSRAGRQLGLFEQEQTRRRRDLDEALDRIADRFGDGTIRRGSGTPKG